jgi:hypothetical protein
MRPFPFILTLLTFLLTLTPLTDAQVDGSWCEVANMTYLQGCCPYIESGPLYPCSTPNFVTNVTECTVDKYPTGWGCCTVSHTYPFNFLSSPSS